MEQSMKLLTRNGPTANSLLTGTKNRRISALAARWRSGYAEDCKSTGGWRKSSHFSDVHPAFSRRKPAGFSRSLLTQNIVLGGAA